MDTWPERLSKMRGGVGAHLEARAAYMGQKRIGPRHGWDTSTCLVAKRAVGALFKSKKNKGRQIFKKVVGWRCEGVTPGPAATEPF